MQALLDGEDAILSILREQLEATVVVNREMTGVGFFTTFAASDDVRRADDRSFKLDDVVANISGLAHGAGFLLYVEHGVLHMPRRIYLRRAVAKRDFSVRVDLQERRSA